MARSGLCQGTIHGILRLKGKSGWLEMRRWVRDRPGGVSRSFCPSAGAQSATGGTTVINVAKGNSEVVTHGVNLERVLVTDPEIADAIPVTAREVVVNGLTAGNTTLLFWDSQGQRHTYSVRVTADVESIQSELERMFPANGVSVSAVGNSSSSPERHRSADGGAGGVAGRPLADGAEILDYISTPDPGQVMLRVRIAEVSRTAIEQLGINLLRLDPNNPRGDDEGMIQSGGVSGPGGSSPAPGSRPARARPSPTR
jgi:Flp pilus assembly secretin CpaC